VAVADRVLRHNFRNETLVIGGQAEYLADELDGEYADVAETIQSHTASLSRLSEQVRDVSTTVEGRSSTQPVELSALVSSVIAGLDTDSVTVRVDLPEQLWVEGVSPDIVETGVRNVVENAIEHNDAAHPRVEITSREAAETVQLRIADNGPGVPEHEREAVTAGRETALRHGSGVGLWLARWGVVAGGGALFFEERDGWQAEMDAPSEDGQGTGTVVVLEFPRPNVETDEVRRAGDGVAEQAASDGRIG